MSMRMLRVGATRWQVEDASTSVQPWAVAEVYSVTAEETGQPAVLALGQPHQPPDVVLGGKGAVKGAWRRVPLVHQPATVGRT